MPPTDDKESTPEVEKVPVGESPPLLLVDLPLTAIKGTITMMKQTVLAAVLGATMAITVPVAASDVVQEAVASEESSWKDKLGSVWEATKEKTTTVFNRDEKLKLYQEQIQILKEKLAQTESKLTISQIETGVEHERMVMCADEVAEYLTGLRESEKKVK